jgi:hypothetical protein
MHDVTRAYDVRLHDVNHTIGLLTSVFFVIFSISEVYRWRHHQPGPSATGAAISRDHLPPAPPSAGTEARSVARMK